LVFLGVGLRRRASAGLGYGWCLYFCTQITMEVDDDPEYMAARKSAAA
jgi:hypothetical protein